MRSIVSLCLIGSLSFAVPAWAQTPSAPARTPATPAAAPASLPAGTHLVHLPEGTAFEALLTHAVSSRTAQVGDTVAMTVKKDVRLEGRVVIQRGTAITGLVTGVERPRRMGRAGRLALGVEGTTSVDGRRVPLRADSSRARKNGTGSTVALSLVVSPLVLLLRGSEDSLAAGTAVAVYTDADVPLVFESAPGSVTAVAARRGAALPAYIPAPRKPVRASGFGAFDRFVGADLAGDVFRVQVAWDRDSDEVTVRFAGVSGEPMIWRLSKTDDPNTLSVARSGAEYQSQVVGRLLPGGVVHIVETYRRQQYVRSFRGDGSALVHEFATGAAKDRELTFLSPDYLHPVNAQVLAQLDQARAESRRAERAAEAEARARRAQGIQNAIQAVSGAVSEGLAEQAAARAENARAEQEAAAARAANARALQEAAAARAAASTTATTSEGASGAGSTSGAPAQQGAMRTPGPRLRANPAGASESPSGEGGAGDASRASTDTDANRCVTTAETKLNATFQGNTAASVLNGCGQPVDVRICLMAEKTDGTKAWNCGVDYGVASQAQASHSSFKATGEIFVDARIAGSRRPLAHPPGYR